MTHPGIHAASRPDAPALIMAATGETTTWADLRRHSVAAANMLLTDRKSFTINAGGVNIYPQEIEDVLLTHPAVHDVAVFGLPNDEYGEEVKAVVEPDPAVIADDVLAAELIAHCRTKLAGYKVPRSIDFELQLPREPTGKLRKHLIRDRYLPDR